MVDHPCLMSLTSVLCLRLKGLRDQPPLSTSAPSLRQPLAARPGLPHGHQSLAEGPRRLWLPDGLDVTRIFWSLLEPRCYKEMTWSLHPVWVMVPRKANIISGCIKRSIMYKIKERKVYFLLPLCA